jgi:hypothetical protein
MRVIDQYTFVHDACNRIRLTAETGIWNGITEDEYFRKCSWQLLAQECTIIFTKEVGYHSGGWWKNPDYERCYHLSISFPGGKNKNTLQKILVGLFRAAYMHLLWVEPPYSPEGKSHDVWHYRLFCDENWHPIHPRGEVYSTQFTEKGWKSFSELHAK